MKLQLLFMVGGLNQSRADEGFVRANMSLEHNNYYNTNNNSVVGLALSIF
jgi:hypothetical protein